MGLWGLLHGISWKAAALLSKLGFIVVIAPAMVSGEFARYLFTVSCAQLVARIICNGAEDQLPLVVSRHPAIKTFSGMGLMTLIASSSLLVLAYSFDSYWLSMSAATLAFFTTAYFSGVIRHLSPSSFEHLHNAPGILFFITTLIMSNRSSENLIIVQTVCNLVLNLWVFARFYDLLKPELADLKHAFAYYHLAGRAGFQKMMSGFSQLLLMRGFIVLPPLVGHPASDKLAFATSIAEGFWQVLLVLSNRNYVRYLKIEHPASFKIFRLSSFLYLFTTVVAFAVLLIASHYGMDQWFNLAGRVDYHLLAGMLLFYGCLLPLLEGRYWDWANHRSPYLHTVMFLILAVPLVLTVMFVPENDWTIAFGILMAFIASLYLGFKLKARA